MKWKCIEPGKWQSDVGWHIARRLENEMHAEYRGWYWNIYGPGDDREAPAEESCVTLREAKQLAEDLYQGEAK